MFQNADEVKQYIEENDVKFVDVRFCDLPGVMQHFTIPARAFDPAEELAFDGSSIRGFQAIHESDMALRADITTARLDPFRKDKTLNINFFIHDPITGEAYSRDPRNIAKKAEAYLASTGIADTAFFGPEAEFYVFDSVRFATSANEGFYHIDSEAGAWNTGSEENNRGYKVRYKGGYFPVAPVDHFADLRAEISLELDAQGLQVERQHHEVGTGGQAEINYKFNTLLAAADDLMLFKYIVKNVAWRNGKTATFMPKPIFGDNGSGMHVHQSLWANGEPLFYDEAGYAGLSDTARYYIGGILKHAPSLLAFTNPTVNSYHRLVPGFERRSTWCTRSATAPPPCASRSRARTRRPSASSSAPRTRPRTRTSPSRRCCSRASTVSRTRSSRWSRSTRTSTSSRPTSTRASRRSRPALRTFSRPWRRTTSTSWPAVSSPPT